MFYEVIIEISQKLFNYLKFVTLICDPNGIIWTVKQACTHDTVEFMPVAKW